MVNFWARATVPEKFGDRLFYQHNENVTLMRTTPDECRAVGEWIGGKLNLCDGPVRFLIPQRGVSALDVEGGPFRDAEADAELVSAIERTVQWNEQRQLVTLDCHINDPEFAAAAVAAFNEIAA